ncbi:hypothetical protein [Methanobrevibacter sp.]|nr:hypothetical protein [Methanobrevibacter sp.]MEE1336081.1 hypothetical protein [Methanobrevibacter sp.]
MIITVHGKWTLLINGNVNFTALIFIIMLKSKIATAICNALI